MLRRALVSLGLVASLAPLSSAQAGGNLWAQPGVNPLNPQTNCSSGVGCWTNSLRVTDLDGDDDLDILLVNYAGFFELGSPEPLVVYRNNGDQTFTNVSATTVGGYSARLRQVAVGDVDGDGDRDIYAPDGHGGSNAYFINDGSGVFTDEIDTLHPAATANAGAARYADVDNDGDLDLFLADGYDGGGEHGHIYTNDGNGALTELAGAIPGPADGVDPDDVDFFDADGDLDLDIMLNVHDGNKNGLWINDGTGIYADASDQFPGQPPGFPFHYAPSVCDVDGDEDLDVWIDNQGPGGSEQLILNDGAANFTDVTIAQVSGNPGADDNQVICVDADGDGDFDAVVLNVTGSSSRLLENDGAGNFTGVAGAFDGATGTLWGEMGDLDVDGRIDIVTGQGEVAFLDRVYFATMVVPVDATPPHIRGTVEQVAADVAETDEPVVRFAVSDETVTDEGPLLTRAFVRVTVDATDTDVPAMFMGGDLFRAVLPAQAAGSAVTYAACAEDRQGNEGCAEALMYGVGGGASGTGGSGDSGDGTAGQTSGPTTTADESGATATASATDGSATGVDTDSGATDGQTGGDDGTSNGCNCRNASGAAPMLLLPVLAAIGRRRRRR